MKYRLDINSSTNFVYIVDVHRELKSSEIKHVPYFECTFENTYIAPYSQRYYLSDLGKKYVYKMLDACCLNDEELSKAKKIVDDLSKEKLTAYLAKDVFIQKNIEDNLNELFNILKNKELVITVTEGEYPDRYGKPKMGKNITKYQSSVEDARYMLAG
jgi:hypothetical protein